MRLEPLLGSAASMPWIVIFLEDPGSRHSTLRRAKQSRFQNTGVDLAGQVLPERMDVAEPKRADAGPDVDAAGVLESSFVQFSAAARRTRCLRLPSKTFVSSENNTLRHLRIRCRFANAMRFAFWLIVSAGFDAYGRADRPAATSRWRTVDGASFTPVRSRNRAEVRWDGSSGCRRTM